MDRMVETVALVETALPTRRVETDPPAVKVAVVVTTTSVGVTEVAAVPVEMEPARATPEQVVKAGKAVIQRRSRVRAAEEVRADTAKTPSVKAARVAMVVLEGKVASQAVMAVRAVRAETLLAVAVPVVKAAKAAVATSVVTVVLAAAGARPVVTVAVVVKAETVPGALTVKTAPRDMAVMRMAGPLTTCSACGTSSRTSSRSFQFPVAAAAAADPTTTLSGPMMSA